MVEGEIFVHFGTRILPRGEPRNLQVHTVGVRWALSGGTPDGRRHAGGATAPHSRFLRGHVRTHGYPLLINRKPTSALRQLSTHRVDNGRIYGYSAPACESTGRWPHQSRRYD